MRVQPRTELGDREDREHHAGARSPRKRERAPGAPGDVAAERRVARSRRAARPAAPAGGPSTCRAVKTSQAMKLTLCIGSSVEREEGPTNSSATPLANTTTVLSTTSGASARSAAAGGPLRR